MLRKIFLTALISLILWQEVNSVDCSTGTTSTSCGKISGCTWQSGTCACASQVAMDILFALDSSGSIGATAFKTEKTFLSNLIYSGLAQEARIDIIRFSTYVDVLLTFPNSTLMSTTELQTFVNNIVYNGGSTDTVSAIKEAINQFDLYSTSNRSKVLVLVTDGNPNAPNGGSNNVCAYSSTLKADDIEVVIIGVGSSWTPALLDCLVTSDDNIIYVDDFTAADFDSILPQITAITCPVTYELIITEIQVDPTEQNGNLTGSRFIEIYNPSTAVTLTDLSLTGLFTGSITSDSSIVLKQNQYLVIYDPPPNVPDYPNCIDCGCTLNTSTGHNWCSASLYLPCKTGCVVDTTMNKTYFNQRLIDDSVFLEIDYVAWDSSWPTALTGYSYYLKGKLYDNSLGPNWAMSCNVRGTPGSDPINNCTATCDSDDFCKLNGDSNAACTTKGTSCTCSNGYYVSDITCYLVPPPGTCYTYWLKNDSVKYAQYIWDKPNTNVDVTYQLQYYSSDSGGLDTIISPARTRFILDYQWDRGSDEIAGYVRTVINGSTSAAVNCTVITSAPTSSPTVLPTTFPTPSPTQQPTFGPTYEPPHVYISGDICERDRCDCYGGSWSCVGDDVYKEYAETDASIDTYVTVRKWPSDFPYLTTVCWRITPQGAYNESTLSDGSSSSSSSSQKVLYNKNGQQRLLSISTTTDVPDMSTTDVPDMSTTKDTTNQDITPTSGCLVYNNSFEEKIVLKIIEESVIANSKTDSAYELFLLELLNCTIISSQECQIVYPSQLYMIIQDTSGGGGSLNSSSEKDMPWWLWYVIAALILFLFILAWLVYRYWWKNKQTNEQLQETEAQLDDQIAENELGFGNDLGQGDVGFNPLATGVPNTTKAPDGFSAELDARKAGNANNNVDVNVEKFSHREEFGQAKPGRKGNNLNEPLLGNGF